MNMAELIAKRESDLRTEIGRRNAILAKRNANAEELGHLRAKDALTAADEARVTALRTENADLDGDLDDRSTDILRRREEIDQLRTDHAEDQQNDRLQRQSHSTGASRSAHDREVNVTRTAVTEPRTYSAERSAGNYTSFLNDLYRSQFLSDGDASDRLRRHGEEVRVDQPVMYERAVSSGGVAGFVPPQYLTELFAEYLRAGAPAANLCSTIPLPEFGLTLSIPRVTTGTAVTVQASENSDIGTNDIDDTAYTLPVATIAGYVDVSRQSLDRGIGVEELIFADLASDYARKKDQQVLAGLGTGGEVTGIRGISGRSTVSYTDTTPTLAELYPKIADAIGRVTGSRFTGPTAMVMHPTRWAWISAQLGTDGRPIIGGAAPVNVVGVQNGVDYATTARVLQDVPVILDGNVGDTYGASTNEDEIYIVDWRDIHLMEENGGVPTQLRFDAPGAKTLTSTLVAYGYMALSAGRYPKAISVVSGTGLSTPSF